jgi:hypothetical protein
VDKRLHIGHVVISSEPCCTHRHITERSSSTTSQLQTIFDSMAPSICLLFICSWGRWGFREGTQPIGAMRLSFWVPFFESCIDSVCLVLIKRWRNCGGTRIRSTFHMQDSWHILIHWNMTQSYTIGGLQHNRQTVCWRCIFISTLVKTNRSSSASAWYEYSGPTLIVSSTCLGVSGSRVVSLEIGLHLGIIS